MKTLVVRSARCLVVVSLALAGGVRGLDGESWTLTSDAIRRGTLMADRQRLTTAPPWGCLVPP